MFVGVLAKFADLQGREEQEDAVRRGRKKVNIGLCGWPGILEGPSAPGELVLLLAYSLHK